MVSSRYWDHQPETEVWAEPGITLTFKTPSYEWLREKVAELENSDFRLPLKGANFEEAVAKDIAKSQKEVEEDPSSGRIAYWHWN